MKSARLFASILVFFSVAYHFAVSQTVVTGTYPFGSFAGGPDAVNLGNLNVNWQIPIMNKAGRGQNFVFNLAYDSSIWYPATVNGSQVWTPVSQWGWSGLQQSVGSTYYTYTTTLQSTSQCPIGPTPSNGPPPLGTLYTYRATNLVYVDAFGNTHPFSGFSVGYLVSPGGSFGCPPTGLDASTTPTTISATDTSGFTATYSEGSNFSFNMTVTSKSGATIIPTDGPGQLFGSTIYTSTDRNGNQITGNAGVYTDTLGQTALTVTGSNPQVLSYTNASGGTERYTVNYSPYNVQTNFNCSTVKDYPQTSQQLVSSIDLPDGRSYTFQYELTPGSSSNVTGRIASVTLPTGGTISYTYTGNNSGIECSDGSTAGLTRTTPDGEWTYARSGSGFVWATTVTAPSYQGVQSQPVQDKTVLSFLTQSGTAPYYFYETSRQNYSGSSTLLETILHCYEVSGSSSCSTTTGDTSSFAPSAIQFITTTYQWPSNTGISSGTYDTYDSVGNNTEHEVFDYGSAGTGTYGSALQTTFTGYNTKLGSSGAVTDEVLSGVTVSEDVSGQNVAIASTQYTYSTTVTSTSGTPSHVTPPANLGNPTSMKKLVSGSTFQTSSYTYFDTGNVQTATDVNGNVTTYAYGDCGNSFPTSVSTPTGVGSITLATSETWNCVGGVPLTSVDANNNTTSYSYGSDPYWRPVSATSYSGTSAAITTSYGYPTGTGSSNSSSSSMSFNGGSSANDSVTFYDGLGRTILQQTRQGPTATAADSVATVYDSHGRMTMQTLPYSGSLDDSVPSTPGKLYLYDALNRPAEVEDRGAGTTLYTYNQNDVLVTIGPAPSGENTKRRNLEYNGAGWLTSVCEVTSLSGSGTCAQSSTNTGYFTKYTYDPGGRLTQVQQNAQTGSSGVQTRMVSYDGLSRKTLETIPEWSAGTGTAGTSTYTYDTATSSCSGSSTGDLIQSQDSMGNITCYTYDKLHRNLSTAVASGPYASVTPAAYYVYDAASYSGTAMQNAKGAVAEAYTCATSACSSKLTDIFSSNTPVTSGAMQGGVQSQMWESTPHSGGYFLTTDTYYPNGAVGAISASLVGGSAGSTTNLVPDSTQVGGGSWSPYCAASSTSNGIVVDTTAVAAPDGSGTATQFTMPSSFSCGTPNSWGGVTNTQGGLTAGDTYTLSIWLKGAVGGESVDVALNDCTGTTFTLTTSWQRYSTTYSSISSSVVNCATGTRGFQFFGATPSSTFYAWGAQSVQAATDEPYVATTDGAATYIGIPDLTFGVDGEGRPSTASDGTNTLVTTTAYNPASEATQVTYGNSATGSAADQDTFAYDPFTNRPTTLTYTVSPSSGSYSVTTGLTWNPNWSLQQMKYTDKSPNSLSQTCAYAADDLSRISSVSCGSSTWAQTFTYDPFGNITKSGSVSYSAGYSPVTNQVSSGIAPPAPTYDKNGNQLISTPANLAWNAWNVPISVNSTTATYDALGRMVEKGVGSTFTQFVFRPSGANLAVYSGSLSKGTVPLPGGNTAIYNNSGLAYIRHTDWLGSSRFATTWAHGVYSEEAYAPFGETYNEAGTPDRSFTGQDQDVQTGSAGGGVYDFLFRKYDPSAGRWLSPDPSGWGAVSQTDPRSLNRYAYVLNNPLSLTDPYGLDCAWQNDDGSVSTSQGDCPTTGPGANGTYIDTDGVDGAWFDGNGDLAGYCVGGNCFDGGGNPLDNGGVLNVTTWAAPIIDDIPTVSVAINSGMLLYSLFGQGPNSPPWIPPNVAQRAGANPPVRPTDPPIPRPIPDPNNRPINIPDGKPTTPLQTLMYIMLQMLRALDEWKNPSAAPGLPPIFIMPCNSPSYQRNNPLGCPQPSA